MATPITALMRVRDIVPFLRRRAERCGGDNLEGRCDRNLRLGATQQFRWCYSGEQSGDIIASFHSRKRL